MIALPQINPEAFRIGPVAVRWYGLMYAVGFAAAMALGTRRASLTKLFPEPDRFQDMMFATMVGLVIGARLGYVLLYTNFGFLKNPWDIIAVWKGGMSFHGGLVGIVCALLIFSRRHGMHLLGIGDFIAPLAPPGLMAGRLGNFINTELWGRPSDLPWAVNISGSGGRIPLPPSQPALRGPAGGRRDICHLMGFFGKNKAQRCRYRIVFIALRDVPLFGRVHASTGRANGVCRFELDDHGTSPLDSHGGRGCVALDSLRRMGKRVDFPGWDCKYSLD